MAQKHTLDYKEYPMTRDGRIQGPSRRYRRLRHPSFAADLWTAKNPLLQRGEIGVEIDTNKIKAGDGITYWNDLPYVTSVGQPLSTANYQMGNSSGGWTTMSQAQQDALNSGATTTNISQISTNTSAIAGKVSIDGSSTMTGVLKMRASISFECAIAPYWHGVGLYQLNDDDSVTLLASMETPDGWCPGTNDTFNMGSTSKKWKNLYLSGTAYIGAINNGFNITVPVTNSADEFALKSQVDLKANSADLGTAAYTASTDYATAAQGALADTAVQPGDLATVATTGNFSDLQNKPTTLSGYGITDGANTDLSNLTSTGANIGNWSHNVSNCITEIPQDIKLELSSSTLTLKAGSKVYVPNGVGVFDEVTVASDVSITPGSTLTTGVYLLFYNGNTFDYYNMQNIVSGAADPMVGQPWHIWYDTTNNVVKAYRDSGSDVARTQSLPIAELDVSNGVGVVSIRKIFNGFGYIGSTVFALPGVKGLIPNGRNDDRTLKNIYVSQTSVVTFEVQDVSRLDVAIFIKSDHTLQAWGRDGGNIVSLATKPAVAPIIFCRAYIEDENLWYHSYATTDWEARDGTDEIVEICAVTTDANRKITDFRPKTTFHALNYNDTEYIGHQSKPSNKYIDLTPGASGTVYNMPLDGCLCVGVTHPDNANWEAISVDVLDANSNFLFNVGGTYNLNNQAYWFLVPVSKGFKAQIWINGFSFNRLRFIYDNGSV